MDALHHLHQALSADGTLGEGLKARLDGHDPPGSGRGPSGAGPSSQASLTRRLTRLRRDLVASGWPQRHSGLLLAQLLGGSSTVARGDGVRLGGDRQHVAFSAAVRLPRVHSQPRAADSSHLRKSA